MLRCFDDAYLSLMQQLLTALTVKCQEMSMGEHYLKIASGSHIVSAIGATDVAV